MATDQKQTDGYSRKKTLLLSPAIGDWTTYKPQRSHAKRIRTGLYNFDHISEQGLNEGLFIHYRFITSLLKSLKLELKLLSELYSASAEQCNYLQFVKNINAPLLHMRLSIPGIFDPVDLCIDIHLANSIINYALGSKDSAPFTRALTEAEEKVIKTTLQEYINKHYVDSFARIFDKAQLSLISSPQFTPNSSLNPMNTYTIYSFELAFGESSPGKIKVVYPGPVMQLLLDKFRQKQSHTALNLSKLPSALMHQIMVPIKAVLGSTWATTADLENLEAGDVVELDTSINYAVSAHIGNNPTFLAQPGKSGKRLVIRMLGLQKDEKIKIETPLIIEEENAADGDYTEENAAEAPLEENPQEEYANDVLTEENQPIEDFSNENEQSEENLNEDAFDLNLDDLKI